MPVTVVNIRIVRMAVHERFMRVMVGVRLDAVPREVVRVLVVRIVRMPMRVRERLVRVRVLVPLGEVQPYASRHESGRSPEKQSRCFVKPRQRHRRTDEGCSRKICAGARAPQMPQREHEQHEAYAIAKRTHRASGSKSEIAGQGVTQRERQTGINQPGDETLQARDLHWVAGCDLAREVVVYRPGEAGADDSERRKRRINRFALPR